MGNGPMPAPTKTTAVLQLLCLIAVALAVPALVCRGVRVVEAESFPTGEKLDPTTERQRLQQDQPDWIFVGNSMLNSRVDTRYLSRISGHKIRKVSEGGTQSALWFLFLKRIICESGVKPANVTVFFRETDLTWPDFRVTGLNEQLIAKLDGPAQPEWQQVMAWRTAAGAGIAGATSTALKTLLPSDALLDYSRTRLQGFAFELTEFGQSVPHGVRRVELNELFSLSGLRHDLGSDAATANGSAAQTTNNSAAIADPGVYENGPMHFDPSPSASFLPHMIALAKSSGFKLNFHRVKRRAQVSGLAADSRLTQAYMADLRAYLATQDCTFTDESKDAAITADLYADGDHISSATAVQHRYNDILWQRLRPVIGNGSRNPKP